jgi:hypothetical protein
MPVMISSFGLSSPDVPAGVPLIGYDNNITAAGTVSDTEVTGHPATNVANPATHLYWLGNNAVAGTTENIFMHCGTGTRNYIGIAGHNFGSGGIQIYAAEASGSPEIPIIWTNVLPVADDSPLIIRFNPIVLSTLRIELLLSGTAPRVAAIYVGTILPLERGIKVDVPHVPITYGRQTRVVNGFSEFGNFLGRIVNSEARQSTAEFFGFSPSWFRTNMNPFLATAVEKPFFWAWAPDEYPKETGYCWLLSDPQPEVSPDTRRVSLKLEMGAIA